jgi:hypothetical protein
MQEDSEIKAKKNEALKVTNKQKKLTPKQIINKALNKEKADKLKSEIRLEHGVRTLYWNHTKNYSKQMQLEESNYVAENVKKYTLHKFLKFFMEKPYHFSMIRKFVHEYLQKEALKPEDRYLVDIDNLRSGSYYRVQLLTRTRIPTTMHALMLLALAHPNISRELLTWTSKELKKLLTTPFMLRS